MSGDYLGMVILEEYKADGNTQRIIYAPEKDQIIHQYQFMGKGSWCNDPDTMGNDTEEYIINYCNEYLPHLRHVVKFSAMVVTLDGRVCVQITPMCDTIAEAVEYATEVFESNTSYVLKIFQDQVNPD